VPVLLSELIAGYVDRIRVVGLTQDSHDSPAVV
jgi:hypothetical protein